MPHPVLEAAERFRAAALARERSAATALVRAYGQVYRGVDAQIGALEEAVRGLLTDGQPPTRAQVTQLNALRALANDVEREIERFAAFADVQIAQEARAAMGAALADSEALVMAHFDPAWLAEQGLTVNGGRVQAGLRAAWRRLPVEAVEQLAGMTQPGSPLRGALVDRLGEATAQRMVDALVQGIALGRNPRTIVRQSLGAGLNWTLTTARTAQLYAYREATRANYTANSDIVAGWRWLATFDARTCISCLAMHGREFPADAVLNDHHNGRCTQVPVVPLAARLGISAPELGSGEGWFRGQSRATQRAMMGPGLWDEWSAGRVAFGELTTSYDDPVYGDMRRTPTLEAVLNRDVVRG